MNAWRRFCLCEHHGGVTTHINFHDNLLNVLLSRQLPSDCNRSNPLVKRRWSAGGGAVNGAPNGSLVDRQRRHPRVV
jgi:hypothetical protein